MTTLSRWDFLSAQGTNLPGHHYHQVQNVVCFQNSGLLTIRYIYTSAALVLPEQTRFIRLCVKFHRISADSHRLQVEIESLVLIAPFKVRTLHWRYSRHTVHRVPHNDIKCALRVS